MLLGKKSPRGFSATTPRCAWLIGKPSAPVMPVCHNPRCRSDAGNNFLPIFRQIL
jgi:hypothetical protein